MADIKLLGLIKNQTMLFNDLLVNSNKTIEPDIDLLFENILKKQTHPGDLLLVRENGFFDEKMTNITFPDRKITPYLIGPNHEGYSEQDHYNFIHNYRTQAIYGKPYSEYLDEVKYSSERSKEIDELESKEALSIQLEMLIYLKIWEGDMFIKKLYQLTNLSQGRPYDWHFSIAESSRDKKATGTREKIIRKKIRDQLKTEYPSLYRSIKNAYLTQVRNSIAHSNYSFLGRTIQLNNRIETDPAAQLHFISFDTWNEMFHDTMTLYNQMIRFFKAVDGYYISLAKQNNLEFEIRINQQVPEAKTVYHLMTWDEDRHGWIPKH